MKKLFIILIFLLIAGTLFAAWDRNALHKGNVTAVAVSPTFDTDGKVLIAVEGKGVLQSTDYGRNWSAYSTGLDSLNITSIEISADGGTEFLGTKDLGLYKRIRDGKEWVNIASGMSNYHVTSIVVSPIFQEDGTVFVGTYGGGVNKSTIGGGEWQAVGGGSDYILSLAISPDYSTKQIIYSGTDGKGVYRSSDGGKNWVTANGGLPDGAAVRSIGISPDFANDKYLYAGLTGATNPDATGLYETRDGGDSWLMVCEDAMGKEVWKTAVSPVFHLRDYYVYAGTKTGVHLYEADNGNCQALSDPKLSSAWALDIGFSNKFNVEDQIMFMGLWDAGLRKSDDSGGSSAEVYASHSETNAFALGIAPDFHVKNDILFVSTGDRGLMRSVNEGRSWTSMNSYDYTSDPDGFRSIVLSPDFTVGTDGTLFGGTEGRGLLMSNDGGNTWFDRNGIAEDRQLLPAGCTITAIAISPDYSTDGLLFVGTEQYGLYRSDDTGDHWVKVEALSLAAISGLGMSPKFTSDGHMYAIGDDPGYIYQSTDGGHKWQRMVVDGELLPHFQCMTLSPFYASDGTIFLGAEGDYGIYRTITFGDSWSVISQTGFPQTGVGGINTLAVSPGFNSGSAKDRIYSGTGLKGVYAADNGTAAPKEIAWYDYNTGLTDPTVNSIVLSPQYTSDGYLYAGTQHDGILFSQHKDSGGEWAGTFNNTSLTDKIQDTAIYPGNENTIMIATPEGVFLSENGGETYKPFNEGILGSGDVYRGMLAVAFYDGGTGVYPLAGSGDGMIFRRPDMSSSWGVVYKDSDPITEFTIVGSYIYASTLGRGVLISKDEGQTWKTSNSGIPSYQIRDIHGLSSSKTLVASSAPIKPKDCCVGTLWGGSAGDGVSNSLDGGDSWNSANGCDLGEDLSGTNVQTVLASTGGWALAGTDGLESGGAAMYRANDANDPCWLICNSGLESTSLDIRDIVEAPNGDILCGVYGSSDGGAYLSADNGEHWYEINQGFDGTAYSVEDVIAGSSGVYFAGKSGDGSWSTTVTASPAPTVSSLDVGSGTTGGGTSVTVTGTGFDSGAVVEFDDMDASTTYVNTTTLTCTTPAHPKGTVDVSVRNSDTRTGTKSSAFTYTDPGTMISLTMSKNSGNIELSWTSDGSGSYKVYKDINNDFSSLYREVTDTSGTTYSDGEGLGDSYVWYYKVE